VRFLAGLVKAESMVHILTHRKRRGSVGAASTRNARAHEILRFVLTESLENIDETHQIVLDKSERVLQRIVGSCLRGQMNDSLESARSENLIQGTCVSYDRFRKK
jgi:hypothetical protein